MSGGFCQCKIRGCFSPAFTSQFFETSAAFELGKVLQPTAVGSSRSHLCKTVWQRAKSFLGLFFPFICWSRKDLGLAGAAVWLPWPSACFSDAAEPRTSMAEVPMATSGGYWKPDLQSRIPTSWPAAVRRRRMELDRSWGD